jgi:hypothetical protein
MIVKEIAFDELTATALEAFEGGLGRPATMAEYAALLRALSAAFTAIADFGDDNHTPTIGSKQ